MGSSTARAWATSCSQSEIRSASVRPSRWASSARRVVTDSAVCTTTSSQDGRGDQSRQLRRRASSIRRGGCSASTRSSTARPGESPLSPFRSNSRCRCWKRSLRTVASFTASTSTRSPPDNGGLVIAKVVPDGPAAKVAADRRHHCCNQRSAGGRTAGAVSKQISAADPGSDVKLRLLRWSTLEVHPRACVRRPRHRHT